MLGHFSQRRLLVRLSELETQPAVRQQLVEIITRGHQLGLDWYFTKIPDLRCGQKEVSNIRAAAAHFRIWIKTRNTLQVDFFVNRPTIPLNQANITALLASMKVFALENPAKRPFGGFLPDQYIQSDKMIGFDLRVRTSSNGGREARLARLQKANPQPKQRHQQVIVFDRNPDVVAECLHLAKDVCQSCKKKAPFLRRSDGSAYLEVHHTIPLIEGGTDTLNNVQALCPNCHRQMHHGNL